MKRMRAQEIKNHQGEEIGAMIGIGGETSIGAGMKKEGETGRRRTGRGHQDQSQVRMVTTVTQAIFILHSHHQTRVKLSHKLQKDTNFIKKGKNSENWKKRRRHQPS